MEHRLKTPIAFFIFNRPEQTRFVFEAIQEAKPERILVVADGPRHESERELCEAARAVIDNINWKCDVQKDYSETNMGCRARVSSGLDWVFQETDRAIILEDDCLPHSTFFLFCEKLLNHYAQDEQVMHISGNFFQEKNRRFRSRDSYYFSVLPHIWGWASWRRAWKYYDVNMKKWPKIRTSGALRKIITDPAVYEYWKTVWDEYYKGAIASWDGQWAFACMLQEGLSINPTVNLVSNIGFGPDARGTNDANSIFANRPTKEIKFPIIHPKNIKPDKKADSFTWRQNFGINRKLRQRMLGPLRRYLPNQYNTIKNLFGKKG